MQSIQKEYIEDSPLVRIVKTSSFDWKFLKYLLVSPHASVLKQPNFLTWQPRALQKLLHLSCIKGKNRILK